MPETVVGFELRSGFVSGCCWRDENVSHDLRMLESFMRTLTPPSDGRQGIRLLARREKAPHGRKARCFLTKKDDREALGIFNLIDRQRASNEGY